MSTWVQADIAYFFHLSFLGAKKKKKTKTKYKYEEDSKTTTCSFHLEIAAKAININTLPSTFNGPGDEGINDYLQDTTNLGAYSHLIYNKQGGHMLMTDTGLVSTRPSDCVSWFSVVTVLQMSHQNLKSTSICRPETH